MTVPVDVLVPMHVKLLAQRVCSSDPYPDPDDAEPRQSWLLSDDEREWLLAQGFVVTPLPDTINKFFTPCRVEITPAGAVLYMMQQANPEV
ncbi:MAG: hypothetical protein DI640_13140 [Sphingomonas taxi]|uniref:Uncharacterized protein n=1 Tax=Sphingomonas taxi TaxID=1549858 RepID=A0A2W4YRA2_9SPHN|nr:MAG: hypothetical protein DI640_13140 [Sphingomonas taxi]